MTPMSAAELRALPPTIGLPVLGRALGVSEPVIRERARRGELDPLGIKVVRLGAQYRVVTASVLAFLGIDAAPDSAGSEARPPRTPRHTRPSASALRSVSCDDAGNAS